MVLIVRSGFLRLIKLPKNNFFKQQLNRYISITNQNEPEVLNKLIEKWEGKILFSDYVERKKLKLGYHRNQIVLDKMSKKQKLQAMQVQTIQPLPISLKYHDESTIEEEHYEDNTVNDLEQVKTHFPFSLASSVKLEDVPVEQVTVDDVPTDIANLSEIEVRKRLKMDKDNNLNNWMVEYEGYNDEKITFNDNWSVNYGTPDPNSKISNVPCGGCGALLHCKDISIPGYIPSEIFKNCNNPGAAALSAIICQRCHFLKKYNLALQVHVSPEDYPKVLLSIRERKRALVLLMVDLLDMPCSIWPGIPDLLQKGQPIVVVGNKVDLLPQDSRGFLKRIEENLVESLKLSGFATMNIKHVALISAKTGFGVEELITKLFNIWMYKGDVFLVGCTNVGKSSLFNTLLQSDYCKVQAGDLIQRATISPWPGTTLNLLKFPIMRPDGWKMYIRSKRLMSANKVAAQEKKLKMSLLKTTANANYATLIGHIDRTFSANTEDNLQEVADPFSVSTKSVGTGITQLGINEQDEDYVLNKWCYDTPGVVQPDQITHILTAEELLLTLPKTLIRPRTFTLRPGNSIFIGGLARVDFIEGPVSSRFTIFCSKDLPITICQLDSADHFYKEFLGTDVFLVPTNDPGRLTFWPGLKPKNEITVTGIDKEISCADVVLSSAGWISVTPPKNAQCLLKAWTPDGKGIYIRNPLLPRAVSLRGRRIRHSVAYTSNKFYVK